MGDNRNHSADSRAHMDTNGGFVDDRRHRRQGRRHRLAAEPLAALDNYPDVFRSVPAPSGK